MSLSRQLLTFAAAGAAALAAAACSKRDSSPSTSNSCTVALAGATTSVSSAATTGTIAVTAASTCSWTAQSSAPFITLTSGASGTGNGSVGYSIASNSGDARSASIVVNGAAVNFTQSAAQVQAGAGCTVVLSTTNTKVNSGGGTITITGTTTTSNCAWTAVSNASFLTVPSGTIVGNGSVIVTVAQNSGASRSGTLTIAGQTVTITQDAGVVAAFNMSDPAQTTDATNVCQIRGATGSTTTCTLRSTSFTGSSNSITTYTWTVQYTYGDVTVINSTSSFPNLQIKDSCGKPNSGATDDGALQPLDVTLTVTDSNNNTATAKSGTGNQPPLFLQLFNCNH
jgi:hypothetical protein